jgi:TolB protein
VSPKGEAIVHVSSRDRVAELYATKLDGKSPQRITNTDRDEWGARFSPDGKQIAFISDREGAQRIWLMDFPNGEARRLTQRSPASSRITEDKLAWAPSGKKIAYVLTIPDVPSSVVIFDLENGKETFLRSPTGTGQVSDPWWSPDGRYLAVTVGSEQNQQIWIARENGSAWVKLTNSSGGNWNPIWGGGKPKK